MDPIIEEKRKFNKSKTIMTQTIIQMLVRNYLIHENSDSNIFMYAEVINDIDVFTTKLEQHESMFNKFKAYRSCKEEPTNVDALLVLLDPDNAEDDTTYLSSSKLKESIDVKYSDKIMVKDIISIVNSIEYPENTTMQLIYVSSDKSDYVKNIHTLEDKINNFNMHKEQILQLSDTDLQLVITELHNQFYSSDTISQAFHEIFKNLNSKILLRKYSKDTSKLMPMNKVNDFKFKLSKCIIRELTLWEIIHVPITPNVLENELNIYYDEV